MFGMPLKLFTAAVEDAADKYDCLIHASAHPHLVAWTTALLDEILSRASGPKAQCAEVMNPSRRGTHDMRVTKIFLRKLAQDAHIVQYCELCERFKTSKD